MANNMIKCKNDDGTTYYKFVPPKDSVNVTIHDVSTELISGIDMSECHKNRIPYAFYEEVD